MNTHFFNASLFNGKHLLSTCYIWDTVLKAVSATVPLPACPLSQPTPSPLSEPSWEPVDRVGSYRVSGCELYGSFLFTCCPDDSVHMSARKPFQDSGTGQGRAGQWRLQCPPRRDWLPQEPRRGCLAGEASELDLQGWLLADTEEMGGREFQAKGKLPVKLQRPEETQYVEEIGGQLWGAVCNFQLINPYWFLAMFWALCPRRVKLLKEQAVPGSGSGLSFASAERCPITAKICKSPRNLDSWGYKATHAGGRVSVGKAQSSGLCHQDHLFQMRPQHVGVWTPHLQTLKALEEAESGLGIGWV